MFPERAWKSKLHDTGDMFDGMFIVGIETEQGQATYHYDIDPYWDMFKVKELKKAPKWDGHSPYDAIERIGNLSCEGYRKQSAATDTNVGRKSEWISVEDRLPEKSGDYITYHDHGHCGVIYYNASIHLWNVYYFEDTQNAIRSVTHWMPIPNPPKGE